MPAERLDLADDPRHRLADDELHVLGVESLPERGRAHHVGEERGEDLALLTDGGRHGLRARFTMSLVPPGRAGRPGDEAHYETSS